jgi:NADH-quinone oxidoreductase subunit E
VSSKIEVPSPRAINRKRLEYIRLYSPVKVDVPKARPIDRRLLKYGGSEPSVLKKNIHSPVTPGTINFPPFKVTPELEQTADQRIDHYPADQRRSAVLPLLHEVQHHFGFISPESIDWVAGKLDIAPIKVVEVVTFYPGFRQKAPGKHHFRVCRTLSCAMGGSYELMAKLCEITGIDRSGADSHKDPISVSPCGNYSVEYAECLASCGTAPVCLVNDDFHEDVTADKAKDLITQYNG